MTELTEMTERHEPHSATLSSEALGLWQNNNHELGTKVFSLFNDIPRLAG
jgi:hypothetical protein